MGGAVGRCRRKKRKRSNQTPEVRTIIMRVGHILSESLGRKDTEIYHLHASKELHRSKKMRIKKESCKYMCCKNTSGKGASKALLHSSTL